MSVQGKIRFEALGKSHELRFTTNAMCRLEEEAGMDVIAFFGEVEKQPTFLKVRRAFRCALIGGATDDEAGDIIDALGFQEATALMRQALLVAFPQPEDSGAGKTGAKVTRGNASRPA